jgi:GNAT superfamily N-acetyltransferase
VNRYATFEPTPVRRAAPVPIVVAAMSTDDVVPVAALIAARDGGTVDAIEQKLQNEIEPHTRRAIFVARADAGARPVAFGRVVWIDVPPDLERGAPSGWYLMGLIVDPTVRRRGVGRALVEARLRWLDGRAREVHYVANAENRASIALHAAFGFEEYSRDFVLPGVTFERNGILCRRRIDGPG